MNSSGFTITGLLCTFLGLKQRCYSHQAESHFVSQSLEESDSIFVKAKGRKDDDKKGEENDNKKWCKPFSLSGFISESSSAECCLLFECCFSENEMNQKLGREKSKQKKRNLKKAKLKT